MTSSCINIANHMYIVHTPAHYRYDVVSSAPPIRTPCMVVTVCEWDGFSERFHTSRSKWYVELNSVDNTIPACMSWFQKKMLTTIKNRWYMPVFDQTTIEAVSNGKSEWQFMQHLWLSTIQMQQFQRNLFRCRLPSVVGATIPFLNIRRESLI